MPARDSVTIGALDAVLTNVKLPFGLVLDQVTVSGKGLNLLSDPIELKLPKPGALEVKVSEKSLAAFLEAKSPGGLKDFRVKIVDGALQVNATATLILPIPVKAKCGLQIKDHQQLWVTLLAVEVAGLGGKSLVQDQIDKVNPVFDIVDLPIAGTLEGVTIGDGHVVLTGTVAPID